MKAFVTLTVGLFSLRDYEALFRCSERTLRRYVTLPVGETTRRRREADEREPVRAEAATERDRAISELLASNRRYSTHEVVAALAERGINVSRTTVYDDLIQAGWVSRMRPVHPWTEGDRKAWALRRLRFARANRSVDCRSLLFSDECVVRAVDGKKMQWCRADEEPDPREINKWSASVHVWGCIGADGFRVLVNLTEYRSGVRGGVNSADYCDMLKRFLIPRLGRHERRTGVRCVFQQDGAGIHTSSETLSFLNGQGVTVLDGWPAHSPDLNPIENLWALMKSGLDKELWSDLSQTRDNKQHLWHAVERFWHGIPNATLDRLVMSFEQRLTTCIKNRGEHVGH